MGHYNGQVDNKDNIGIEFLNFREKLSELYPHLDYGEEQGDPQEVLNSLLDQIEVEVGDYFQRRGKKTYGLLINSVNEKSITCSNCGVRRIRSEKIKYRKFHIDGTVKAEQEMGELMKTINIHGGILDYACQSVECVRKHLGKHPAEISVKVTGTPKFIFFLTGIVKPATMKKGETRVRKAMNFKIKLEEYIIIDNIYYRLRNVMSHIGDNDHLKPYTMRSLRDK